MNRNSIFKVGLYTLLGLGAGVALATPQWWTDRGVLNTNSAQDHAAANLGQLKHVASKASEEFQAKLTGIDLSEITGMVAGFSATNNSIAINLGQLKYVAQPYYDVLWDNDLTNAWPVGMTTGPYPWSNSSADYALANLGQLKYLFSFDPAGWHSPVDTDGDGLSDDWERENGLSPTNSDSDGDLLSDGWEVLYGFNPLSSPGAGEADGDADGDGLTNLEEYERGTHPDDITNPSPTGVLVVIPEEGNYLANEPDLELTPSP